MRDCNQFENITQNKTKYKEKWGRTLSYIRERRWPDKHNALGLETTISGLTVCSSKETSLLDRTTFTKYQHTIR